MKINSLSNWLESIKSDPTTDEFVIVPEEFINRDTLELPETKLISAEDVQTWLDLDFINNEE